MSVTFKVLTNDVQCLGGLLGRWAYDPLAYMKFRTRDGVQNYYLDEMRDIQNEGGFIITATEGGEVLACAVLTKLPWDSDCLGYQMGVVKYLIIKEDSACKIDIADKLLKKILKMAMEIKLQFLLCKCSTNDTKVIHTLEKNHFLLMDTMLDYTFDFERTLLKTINIPYCSEEFVLRVANRQDQEELMHLSKLSFASHFGRFHSDEKIDEDQSTTIYEQWLKSSCEGWADLIVVAQHRNKITGYSVWKKPSQRQLRNGITLGHYSIGAIHPSYQQQGLFPVLTYEGMKILSKYCDIIEGPTHINNYGVQRGYAKLGWKICGGRHSFHRWLQ